MRYFYLSSMAMKGGGVALKPCAMWWLWLFVHGEKWWLVVRVGPTHEMLRLTLGAWRRCSSSFGKCLNPKCFRVVPSGAVMALLDASWLYLPL